MKSNIFWNSTPYSPLKVNRRFGGTRRLHFQSRRISQQETIMKEVASESQARNQRKAGSKQSYLLHACFLLGLIFDSEDAGDMFLGNVD
jgi:hypothetical protein